MQVPRSQEGVLRKMGAWGKGDYERPLRAGAHRSRPPAIFGSFHRWKEHPQFLRAAIGRPTLLSPAAPLTNLLQIPMQIE